MLALHDYSPRLTPEIDAYTVCYTMFYNIAVLCADEIERTVMLVEAFFLPPSLPFFLNLKPWSFRTAACSGDHPTTL